MLEQFLAPGVIWLDVACSGFSCDIEFDDLQSKNAAAKALLQGRIAALKQILDQAGDRERNLCDLLAAEQERAAAELLALEAHYQAQIGSGAGNASESILGTTLTDSLHSDVTFSASRVDGAVPARSRADWAISCFALARNSPAACNTQELSLLPQRDNRVYRHGPACGHVARHQSNGRQQ